MLDDGRHTLEQGCVCAHRFLAFLNDVDVEEVDEVDECRISNADDMAEGDDGGKREKASKQ